ncbi:hypothetical protein PUN28_015190 [Cardiocondyla obscurior]|uniref:Uncharacterized protein n=1 Tax=Cardiocondyla obscurior TaxID=286306 RepID=A0AAW2F2T6_9HYME
MESSDEREKPVYIGLERGQSWVRRYHGYQEKHGHTRAPLHTVHICTLRGEDDDYDDDDNDDDDDRVSTVSVARDRKPHALRALIDFVGSYSLSPCKVHGILRAPLSRPRRPPLSAYRCG